MITRALTGRIMAELNDGKAVIILGPRQVGKTTLLKDLFGNDSGTLFLSGDEQDVRQLFQNITSTRLKAVIGDKQTLIIDEAQRIDDIGLKLKLIADYIPEVRLIATGSSSFELASKVNEPLTGRKWEYRMYPLSFGEMVKEHGLLEEKRLIPHRLVYGSYPEVVTHPGQEKDLLMMLSDSYLYKDILLLDNIKKSSGLTTLLQALAYQVGSQVSYNELGQTCGMDAKTVEKYITLLEQCFVVFRLGSFSRNLRNELKSSKKIYFYDNGIRNAIIADFSQAESRRDIGALWENYAISERVKQNAYTCHWCNSWFWRTKEQSEIDYIEESDGNLSAFEFKWNPGARHRTPSSFLKAYPGSNLKVITPYNIEDFLL